MKELICLISTKGKEKIKKILFIIAEVGTVAWAIVGMKTVVSTLTNILRTFGTGKVSELSEIQRGIVLVSEKAGFGYLIIELLFYFLSAVLILYLLRKLQKQI